MLLSIIAFFFFFWSRIQSRKTSSHLVIIFLRTCNSFSAFLFLPEPWHFWIGQITSLDSGLHFAYVPCVFMIRFRLSVFSRQTIKRCCLFSMHNVLPLPWCPVAALLLMMLTWVTWIMLASTSFLCYSHFFSFVINK